ncbi:dynamin family protein [Paenibacillus cellulosilyticus]|uniref:Dynamin family protein n=1 Tax=Paenibacillus cellulosilyticus TaxID=375489 RepID=A0A2V2YZH1_9BACL|nr:dynamin family protein [Paenibacillus cellulosilyticus]PWV99304.1 dynamin family protein [Paenibacillus cellulosilyticus]QKS45069.1 dynamin family protein [Paenibacillus cellulosilyticus]
MKKVFVKYNPYKLETEITVEGKHLAQNSKLREKIADGSRLQEWVEELPSLLIGEYNDKDFQVTFHGTLPDYEDLVDVLTESQRRGELSATFERKPAKETSDKEALIDEVFREIQQGPFDELRDVEIVSAFEHAKSSDFEVCVVATMSAGKSTLINAMLGTKLMPSKQEACTAIITRIKDITQETVPFGAEVYNKEEELAETHASLTYPIMERLNANENVSEIKVSGNIPFVSSEDVSLVLIDTPGPNNSRDTRHGEVQKELLGRSSKALVLYIMTGEFGTDDDNTLLRRVASSMSVGGKQSKDRFIFVVNKMDDRKTEDGDTGHTLERVRSYLKNHGIANPNLFPASAYPALNIRLIESGADVDTDTIDETEMKIRKLNRNQTLHLETYASLPPSLRGEINDQLAAAKETWNGRDIDNANEALIHTGVVSIEAAIRQYVQKYAKTAKVKNIVDTFMHKLDEVGCFEETKRELAHNRNESKRIVKSINVIREKIDNANDAKNFKNNVNDAVVRVNNSSKVAIQDIKKKFENRITKRIDDSRGHELSLEEVEDEVERLMKFVKKLEPDFEEDLDDLIRNDLKETGDALLKEYRDKLRSLIDEMGTQDLNDVTIDPLKIMSGSVQVLDYSVKHLVREEERVVGQEEYEVKERTRGWFSSVAFWPKSEYVTKYRDIRKTIHYVRADELAQEFLSPVQQSLYNNGEAARKYSLQQSTRIAERFNKEFARLDDVLKAKLSELESYATDKEKADERIKESERKLNWLEQIRSKVVSIIEI